MRPLSARAPVRAFAGGAELRVAPVAAEERAGLLDGAAGDSGAPAAG